MSKHLLLWIAAALIIIGGSCGNKGTTSSTQKNDSLSDHQSIPQNNANNDSVVQNNSLEQEADISLDPNSSPENVVKTLIKAGKTGKYKTIAKICNDAVDKDGDAKDICNIANASPEDQADFNDFFGNARIVGNARIRNGIAEVDIETTAEGGDKETIIVQNKYDRWYLKGL